VLLGAGWEENGDVEGEPGGGARGDADWIVTNERGSPAVLRVSFELTSLRPRRVTVRQGAGCSRPGGSRRRWSCPGSRSSCRRGSRIVLKTDQHADEAEEGDGRPLAFRLARLRTEWEH
jgi:hypothetical protein